MSSTLGDRLEVLALAGDEAVDHPHRLATPDERLGQVGSNEAGAARNQIRSHLLKLYGDSAGARLPRAQKLIRKTHPIDRQDATAINRQFVAGVSGGKLRSSRAFSALP